MLPISIEDVIQIPITFIQEIYMDGVSDGLIDKNTPVIRVMMLFCNEPLPEPLIGKN